MNLMKSVGVHVGLTAVAAATALGLWTKEEEPIKVGLAEVRVWGGTPAELQGIRFEGKNLKVQLEPKQDELGRWYVVHVNKLQQKAERPENPHAPAPEEPPPEPKDVGKWVKSTFISVTEGNTLADTIAPLNALRAVGRIDKDREEEFGFDKPEGILSVKIKGAEHKLAVGGLTPGGGDRYVRLLESHEAYAVPGEALRGVLSPESRLLETALHGFEEDALSRIKVTEGMKSRELLRIEGKPNAWASLQAPLAQDETASNWMTKVARLRVSKYVEGEPKGLGQDALVVRVEYFDAKKSLGFLELFKLGAEAGSETKNRYLIRTEHTRWYAEVLASMAEQIEGDLASVVSGAKGPNPN